jgi:hypothetical protein
MEPHKRNTGGVFIPQSEIHVGVVYRHNIWPTWQVTPMRIAGEVVVCQGTDGKHLDLMGERFIKGEFAPMRPFPSSVAYASFDYYETVTALIVFKTGCGIYWHGGLGNRDTITAYELKDLPIDVLEENNHVFGPLRWYTYHAQILEVAKALWGDKWQPVPHNYTLSEITSTIESGVLKPFLVPEPKLNPIVEMPKQDNPPVKSRKKQLSLAGQLSLF